MTQGTVKGDFEIREKRCLMPDTTQRKRSRGRKGWVSQTGRGEVGNRREEASFGSQEWAASPLRCH